MKIKKIQILRLTPRTIEMYKAEEGFACNKTIFLLKEKRQFEDENTEIWEIQNYELDRFGLLNGLMYLLQERETDYVEAFFTNTKKHDVLVMRFDKGMSFTRISEELDALYGSGAVEYR